MRFHLRRVVLGLVGACLVVTVLINQMHEHQTWEHWRFHSFFAARQFVRKSRFAPLLGFSEGDRVFSVPDVFPDTDERLDRVLEQLRLTDVQSRNKIIVLWGGHKGEEGNSLFVQQGCPVTACNLTANRALVPTADMVLFMHDMPVKKQIPKSKREQVRMLYLLESPYHTQQFTGLEQGTVNWTATYRTDSVINTPYERFTLFSNYSGLPDKPARNYAEGKTKMAAWFVSNCNAPNGRDKYVEQLQKYISVDIYGGCGKLKCPRSQSRRCSDYLNADYKFYLAFENSNCEDYITEKFWWNALKNDVVPVVMGARPEDYAALAPEGSYIHVDDFASPLQLAQHLEYLDNNDQAYNQYFRWKGTGKFINTKFWCRVCSMLHVANDFPMWYDDLNAWWRGPGVCINPGTKPWATWRDLNITSNWTETVQYGYDRRLAKANLNL